MSHSSYDAVIVGAGIIGTACAAELSEAGVRVAVVEAKRVGGGATAAAMGHLAVMDDSPAQFALTSYSQKLWHALAPQLPGEAEYCKGGALWVAADDEEMAELKRKHAYYTAGEVCAEMLDTQSLAEAEPNLRPGLAGALLMSDDAVVHPASVACSFAAKATARGATFVFNEAVTELTENEVELRNGNRIHASWIILANGTAACEFIPGLPLRARKGHLVLSDGYPGFVRRQIIELGYLKSAHAQNTDSVAFNIQPRRNGQMLIGSSRQYNSFDSAVESSILSRMLARAAEYMPSITTLKAVRSWTGFRAATPDKLPLIGPYPPLSSVYLATGHEGLGISTSLATAKLLADSILRRASDIDPEPYLPARILNHA